MYTGTVISSKIENIADEFPNDPDDPATGPAFRVNDAGTGETFVVSTVKLMVALDAVLDLGTYPIFLANETTFSLKVALSRNTSLATMLALYEVI